MWPTPWHLWHFTLFFSVQHLSDLLSVSPQREHSFRVFEGVGFWFCLDGQIIRISNCLLVEFVNNRDQGPELVEPFRSCLRRKLLPDNLGGAAVFSKMDLRWGFYNIELHEADKEVFVVTFTTIHIIRSTQVLRAREKERIFSIN